MITSYALHGDFIESCDCFDLCPCWVNDDPDEDHCTGLVAWQLGEESRIGATDVSGAGVAAVTAHSGGRRTASALTVLYVDAHGCPDGAFDLLAAAFAGADGSAAGTRVAGPLGALATVTGTVLLPARRADIDFSAAGTSWTLVVTPRTEKNEAGTGEAVRTSGEPRAFSDNPTAPDAADQDTANQDTANQDTADQDAADQDAADAPSQDAAHPPLELFGTALHAELQIDGPARAQHTIALSVREPALPGGYLEVKGRSGMRGRFTYTHPANNGSGSKRAGGKRQGAVATGTTQVTGKV